MWQKWGLLYVCVWWWNIYLFFHVFLFFKRAYIFLNILRLSACVFAPRECMHCVCVGACDGGSINCLSLSWRAAREPLLNSLLGDLGSYWFHSISLFFCFLINSSSNLLSPLFVLFSFFCRLFTLTFPPPSLLRGAGREKKNHFIFLHHCRLNQWWYEDEEPDANEMKHHGWNTNQDFIITVIMLLIELVKAILALSV